MKIYIDFTEKKVELEGNAAQIQTALDIIAERCLDFAPRVKKRKTINSGQLFKMMMEDLHETD